MGRARAEHLGERLAPRRREVVALTAEGWSNAAIANRLMWSEKAVLKHVAHIDQGLGVPTDPDDRRRGRAVIPSLAR